MKTRPGAHLLVECLVAEGVDQLFGTPGVGTLAVDDAFVEVPNRFMHCTPDTGRSVVTRRGTG